MVQHAAFSIVVGLLVVTGAAAVHANERTNDYAAVLIRDVPHVRQKPDFCGEACAEMYLRKLGAKINQDQVFNVSGLDPLLGRGCYTADLQRALAQLGFRLPEVFAKVRVAELATDMDSQWKRLHAALVQGVPSIVCMRFDQRPNTTEHFRLVLGYDPRSDEVVYHDPAASLRDRERTASSSSRRLSSWTGSPISSRRRASIGTGITECLHRITSSGGP